MVPVTHHSDRSVNLPHLNPSLIKYVPRKILRCPIPSVLESVETHRELPMCTVRLSGGYSESGRTIRCSADRFWGIYVALGFLQY